MMMFSQLFAVVLWVNIANILADVECPFYSLQQFESSVYSQNGEDGIILALMSILGTTDRKYVEFGVENGDQCNTRMLREHHNFTGLLMDGGFENEHLNLRREFLTIDNIVDLFRKYNVPKEFDLLSVDLDMFDFWILEKILKSYSPRIIIAEVNPTLGHNIRSQSHEHFMTSFRELNSLPLVVNHPHTMEQEVWDGTRYSGANPLAMQLLAKEYGYEMVYCESCGVNCFFVQRALLPEACPAAYPTPIIHYPCYGTGEAGLLGHKSDPQSRPPVLLSAALVRQMKQGQGRIDALIADKFSAHMFHLDGRRRRISVDRNELSSALLGGEAALDCGCLAGRTCSPPDASIRSSLNLFRTYLDMYSAVTQPRQSGSEQQIEVSSFDWTCFLLRTLKNSSVCEELGHLHYQQSLSFVQDGLFNDARKVAVAGLKFRPLNRNLLYLVTYFDLNDFMTTTNAGVYSLAFIEMSLNDEVKVIGIGAGVCDNLRHRTQHHAVLSRHHLAVHDKLRAAVLQRSLGGFVSVDDGYTHVARVFAPDDVTLGSRGPYYEGSNHFTSTFTHSCFSDTLFRSVNDRVNRVCEQRSNLKTIIIIPPPFAAVSSGHDINGRIVNHLGCVGSSLLWTATCRRALQSLAAGFLPQMEAMPGVSGEDFWRDATESMYHSALGHRGPLLTISDPLFSFTAAVWKEPVGTAQVVVQLAAPIRVVSCLATIGNVSLESALAHFLLFFTSMLDAVQGFESVLFVQYVWEDVGGFSGRATADGSAAAELTVDRDAAMYAVFGGGLDDSALCLEGATPSRVAVEESRAARIVPEWVQECVVLLLRDGNAELCNAMRPQ